VRLSRESTPRNSLSVRQAILTGFTHSIAFAVKTPRPPHPTNPRAEPRSGLERRPVRARDSQNDERDSDEP
jgi:hypothetical protein